MYYEFTIVHISNNDNVDDDIESPNNDVNTSMEGLQASGNSSNTNNCQPKNKSETETNDIAGVDSEANTNRVLSLIHI